MSTPEVQVQTAEKPAAAFVLSVLAGLWMLAVGGMACGFGGHGMMNSWRGMGGWMWGRGMGSFGVWSPWSGVFAGMVVIIGAVMLYAKPAQRRTWAIVILIASALNFFVGMGGLLAGTLGVSGGALVLTARD